MELFTIDALVYASGGRLARAPGSPRVISRVSIDSRTCGPDTLFVPLPGRFTDGHLHLADAVNRGACALLVAADKQSFLEGDVVNEAKTNDVAIVIVDDTLAALGALAASHVGRFGGVTRIGITGSSGKTTTKEVLGAILSAAGPTMMNEGNLNSEIGLPLAAFGLAEKHKYAIFEMGMNHTGEMDALTGIVAPHVALITNIGTAHIGLLGSQDSIALEKKKIFSRFTGKEKGFVHEDEPYFSFLANGAKGTVLRYGLKSTAGVNGYTDLGLDGTAIDWEGLRVRYPLFGRHNLWNALGALSVAMELGIDRYAVRDGLEAVTPLFGRSEIVRGPVTLIMDCYNANPDSVAHVLGFFDSLTWQGRKIAVLGSMLELGDESDRMHANVRSRALGLSFDAVFFFGAEYEDACRGSDGGGGTPHTEWTDDYERLSASLERYVREGDIILLKGSRGMALERLAEKWRRSRKAARAH